MISERESDKGKIIYLEEDNSLLRHRLFGRKSEQSAAPLTPQMALFNEAESVAEPADETAEEKTVAPARRRGKRKPLPADLPRIGVIHELPDHDLSCTCGCRKHAIGEEVSEQIEIVPMQIRVIKHVRKVYGCRDCETAPVTADKPAQLIEKSSAGASRHRYPPTNLGALGHPMQRAFPAAVELDARQFTVQPNHPLRRNTRPGIERAWP